MKEVEWKDYVKNSIPVRVKWMKRFFGGGNMNMRLIIKDLESLALAIKSSHFMPP